MDRKISPHSALVDVLQQGSISFPVLLFTEYKRLGLNEGQVMLLLHILLFNEKEGITFPTISQLEERMSVKGDRIIQWLQVLVRKGFLSFEETLDDGGLRSEQYSSAPLFNSWRHPIWIGSRSNRMIQWKRLMITCSSFLNGNLVALFLRWNVRH